MKAKLAVSLNPRSAVLASLLVLALVGVSSASAQVNVTATGGTLAASYTTVKGAFDAINAGTHLGTIGIALVGDTTETAPAVLNASGAGAASYTSIGISPSGGAARTISGAIAAGAPLIDLNGADNVTIDGLNTGGNALTIANTTVSATAGTSTIRFIGGATSNVITNSNIQGSSSSSVATNGGTIFFSTDAVTANGNDNNTISNNNIGPAGANLPSKAILGSGSTTTTAIGNSGIVINNNNIFDYFAAAVTSAGIATTGGCNTWSITNNRLYQTGTRTWTTGALHTPMNIGNTTATSGAQAFTITGNIVGFASNTQTGTYTLTGAGTGAKFVGILFNGIVAGTTTNVNNNTVAAVSMTGVTGSGTTSASPFTALLFQEGNGISNGNIIGSQAATGSLVFSTTTTSATDIYGIHNFSSNAWTSNNNSVGGISATNLGASGTFLLVGMRCFTGSTVTWNASTNTVGGTVANSLQLTATGTASQVLGMFTSNAPAVLTSNVIRNLTTNIGTGTTTTASVIGISITSATPSSTLSRNTISSLTNTNAAAASVVTGIQFNGATANLVERNSISGLTVATNSTAAEVNGIRVAGGTTIYRNNMIAVGAGIANAIGTGSTTGGINGIFEAAGTNSIFHNSVYVGGAPTAGVGPSYAFASTQVTVVRSYRDNIFFNARSNAGATGKNYAVRVAGTAPNPAGLTINNNVYFANGTGAVFGFFNSADVPNLVAWRTAVGQDSGSIESNPQYNDPTNAIPDLHIHPTNATVIEGNGADVGVTDDFDGQTRSGLTPVDIGADAGNFNGIDVVAPSISYTPFGNTSTTTNRTVVATLTDATGVATGGLAPRVYYRKNAGAYFSQACSLASGTVNNGTWNCVINNADMGGVAPADVISYFVIAQDTLGNLASNPAGAVATNVNTVTTPPASPNTYTIVVAFSGPIDVGTGQTYTSLTNPGGIFEALNAGALTGNLILNLTSDLLAETGTNPLNQLAEDGVGGYTVTIQPGGGAARTVSGSNTTVLINLNGADRVTFDGLNTGGNALLVRNTSATTGAVFQLTNDASNNQIRNSTIEGGNANTSSALVLIAAGVTTGNDNNTISGNVIRARTDVVGVPANLVASLNASATALNSNNVVSGNQLANFTANGFATSAGATSNNWTVTNNDVSQNATRAGNVFAINTGGMTGTNLISQNSIHGFISSGTNAILGFLVGNSLNLTISRNRIYDFQTTAGATGVIEGIEFDGASGGAANMTVVNNMVTLAPTLATAQSVIGIQDFAFGGNTFTANYNSVFIGGTATGAAPSWAIKRGDLAPTTYTARNNIAFNNRTGGTSSHFAGGDDSANTGTFVSNFNFFAGTGATAANFMDYGTVATGTPVSFAAWMAGPPTRDANSIAGIASSFTVSNIFVDVANGDLHLKPTATVVIGLGTPIAGVTTDFDNDPRSATAPTIGADELTADLSITKTDGVATATPGGSTTYTITASNAGPGGTTGTVTDTFPASLTCTWTCAGTLGGLCTAAGSGNINDPVTLPAGGSVTYTASCSISASATGTLVNTATVAGVAGDPNAVNNTATDTDTVAASADLSITKTDGVTTATAGGSVTYTITASNAGPSNATGATVADTFPASLTCTWTCVGAGGGTCTASGSGNISGSVNLPSGGSVTYTASCAVSAAATGTLSNTATVTAPGGVTDPAPGNNSATDSDTIAASADLGITKTDGVTTATAGGSVTYTITASNAGPSTATGATVADTFPASLTCTWTCVGAGGGTCTAAGSGNINGSVNLPAGGSVTYTASCAISAAATGTLSNTATVTAPGGVTDPTPGNNSATDSDTLAANSDLSITKTDGVTTATAGGSVTYTITASNAGPSNATGATVADTFPASLTCTWTCAGAGGGTCAAAGSGNINGTVNLPSGGSVTYTASCTISAAATGTLSNTTTVTAPAGVTDPTPGNNSATDSDTLAASSDLAITKTDGVTTVTAGGSATYTITASNAGPSNATGATVADTFPASLTCTWTCTGAGGGTCTAAGSGNINGTVNLPAGGSVTYTASCTISGAATGTLSNTATVTAPAGVTDPTPGNNSATDSDTLGVSADLSITKTDGVTTATAGGSVTYTITASNAGPSVATGATVADTFPASLTCTWTCTGAGGGTCTAAGSGNINGTVNLPSGGSVTYTASCAISAAATGTLSNTATVTAPAGVADPTPGNNSATDSDTLGASADLSITKTDGVTTATAGGSVTYTIVASNAGPSNATGATVADTFPASLTCTWTCTGAGGGTCTAAGSGNINGTVNLPSGGSVTYTASCAVSAAATGTLANTATVTAPAGVTDPTPGNNSATDSDTVGASADLSITKTDGVTAATAGGSVTYTVVASNAGPSNATGATVADTFPASLTCTWTCAGAGGGTCTAAGSGNIGDTVNLPSGGSVTYTASCTISAAATGSLVNTATVTAPAGVTDPTPGNNSATDTDALGASADLSVTKTDGVTSVTAGGSATYTIVASNAGPSTATGATVADTFPATLTCTWTCAGAGGGTCTAAGSGNIGDTVNLPSGGSVTYTASCTVSAAATGTLANTATVAAPAGVTDPTPGNNSATDTDTISAAPGASVSGTKTAAGTFTPSSTVTYTIVLTNSGSGAQADNPGNELIDVLPAQLTLVSATATSGTAVATVGTNTVTWNGAIPAAGTVTITITATINAGATGSISNQGTISYDTDGNGTNDGTAQTDDPATPGAANPTAIVVVGGPTPPPIPTLSDFGLLALAAALAMMALAVMRRRRSGQAG